MAVRLAVTYRFSPFGESAHASVWVSTRVHPAPPSSSHCANAAIWPDSLSSATDATTEQDPQVPEQSAFAVPWCLACSVSRFSVAEACASWVQFAPSG